MMPRVDGLTVLERVRGTPDPAGLPVVLYTAGHDPDAAETGMALGAQGVVFKTGVGGAVPEGEAVPRARWGR
jgi:CheY-like chemotaxis protein